MLFQPFATSPVKLSKYLDLFSKHLLMEKNRNRSDIIPCQYNR